MGVEELKRFFLTFLSFKIMGLLLTKPTVDFVVERRCSAQTVASIVPPACQISDMPSSSITTPNISQSPSQISFSFTPNIPAGSSPSQIQLNEHTLAHQPYTENHLSRDNCPSHDESPCRSVSQTFHDKSPTRILSPSCPDSPTRRVANLRDEALSRIKYHLSQDSPPKYTDFFSEDEDTFHDHSPPREHLIDKKHSSLKSHSQVYSLSRPHSPRDYSSKSNPSRDFSPLKFHFSRSPSPRDNSLSRPHSAQASPARPPSLQDYSSSRFQSWRDSVPMEAHSSPLRHSIPPFHLSSPAPQSSTHPFHNRHCTPACHSSPRTKSSKANTYPALIFPRIVTRQTTPELSRVTKTGLNQVSDWLSSKERVSRYSMGDFLRRICFDTEQAIAPVMNTVMPTLNTLLAPQAMRAYCEVTPAYLIDRDYFSTQQTTTTNSQR